MNSKRKGLVPAYIFLTFLACLMVFVGFISIPVNNIDVSKTGCPATETRKWYVLGEGTYTPVQSVGSVVHHRSFMPLLTSTEYIYYLVTVDEGPGSPYDLVVRAYGKEADALAEGKSIKLYGMVSPYYLEGGSDTIRMSCLNDNGDTILLRIFKSLFAFTCAVVAIYLEVMLIRGKTFKRGEGR